MAEQFKKKMDGLSLDQIVELVERAWNEDYSPIVNEAAFDSIEERWGEDKADEVYEMVYSRMAA